MPILTYYNMPLFSASENRCICGNCSLASLEQGSQIRYCSSCAEKRKTYVEQITGVISLKKKVEFASYLLETLEKMRREETIKALYTKIDQYFVRRGYDSSEEPYDNPDFIIQSLKSKISVLEHFSIAISQQVPSESIYYRKEAEMMKRKDLENIVALQRGKSSSYQKQTKPDI